MTPIKDAQILMSQGDQDHLMTDRGRIETEDDPLNKAQPVLLINDKPTVVEGELKVSGSAQKNSRYRDSNIFVNGDNEVVDDVF